MKTFTGRRFDPFRPELVQFDVLDIAHGLANVCRYGGQSAWHFSVAQHSVLVSRLIQRNIEEGIWAGTALPKKRAALYMMGLLHDLDEAYLGDIPRQIKYATPFEFYRALGKDYQRRGFDHFGITDYETAYEYVKWADDQVLVNEGIILMNERYEDYGWPHASVKIEEWTPREAKQRFIDRFHEILAIRL